MSLTDLVTPSPAEDFLKLKAELDDILKEQAGGRWDEAEKEGKADWVQLRVRRCIELTSILRRTNTGPAKAGGRGKTKKPKMDLESIKNDLLS